MRAARARPGGVEQTHREDQDAAISEGRTAVRRAISGPLTPVASGLSRSLACTPPRRSGHVTGPDGTDSQADSAGSVPVTRSTPRIRSSDARFMLPYLTPRDAGLRVACPLCARSACGTLRAGCLQLPPGHPVERRGELLFPFLTGVEIDPAARVDEWPIRFISSPSEAPASELVKSRVPTMLSRPARRTDGCGICPRRRVFRLCLHHTGIRCNRTGCIIVRLHASG